MLDPCRFVHQLADQDFTHLCVVPCSFAKHLINAALNSGRLEYLPAANEGVACSVAAGLKLAGRKPLVIAQSSGLTNMGSCITSLLKPYGIPLAILVSWRSYQPGSSEIQHQHLATALPELIHAYGLPHEFLDQENLGQAVAQLASADQTGTLVVLRKETFAPTALNPQHQPDLGHYLPRGRFLQLLHARYRGTPTVFIGTTGHTVREMAAMMPQTRNFAMAGNMGGALSIGLGAALAGCRVMVCGGDAEFVMHMGGLATAGRYGNMPGHLTYLVFDNESNKSTGGQPTQQRHLDYRGVAAACGFHVFPETVYTETEFEAALAVTEQAAAPSLIHIKCAYDAEMPRPGADAIIASKKFFAP